MSETATVAVVTGASRGCPGHFWEKPLAIVDMLDVGSRSGYVASYYAAPTMVH